MGRLGNSQLRRKRNQKEFKRFLKKQKNNNKKAIKEMEMDVSEQRQYPSKFF